MLIEKIRIFEIQVRFFGSGELENICLIVENRTYAPNTFQQPR